MRSPFWWRTLSWSETYNESLTPTAREENFVNFGEVDVFALKLQDFRALIETFRCASQWVRLLVLGQNALCTIINLDCHWNYFKCLTATIEGNRYWFSHELQQVPHTKANSSILRPSGFKAVMIEGSTADSTLRSVLLNSKALQTRSATSSLWIVPIAIGYSVRIASPLAASLFSPPGRITVQFI